MRLIIILLLITSCNSNQKRIASSTQNQKFSQREASIKRGKLIYNDMCITCHLTNGEGIPKIFPPLASSDYLEKNQDESIKGIKKGISGEIVVNGITYNNVMTPLGLSNKEVADVTNYINTSWGNAIDNFITAEKVSKL